MPALQELIKIIQTTQIPIVCCCNDESHQKVRALKKYCACMPFVKPQPEMVAGRIMKIAKDEGMDLSEHRLARATMSTVECRLSARENAPPNHCATWKLRPHLL